MKIALIGYGNVGRALARLLAKKRKEFGFTVSGIHTARHGTALRPEGLPDDPAFGPACPSAEAFLDAAGASVLVEASTLDPFSGEPAASHIRAALGRGMHVVTANKGPVAHFWSELSGLASRHRVLLRCEATVLDGAPVFRLARQMPGVRVLGFTGVLNSTSKVVVETMEQGGSFDDGIAEARRLGITEADAAFDVDGWDSACKTAALANVMMSARVTPRDVSTKGIGRLTPGRVRELGSQGKTVRLVSRARASASGVSLRVRAEVLDKSDLLAAVRGTSNLLLVHTDLMGTVGTVSISPGVDQTAYGVFSDLAEIKSAMMITS